MKQKIGLTKWFSTALVNVQHNTCTIIKTKETDIENDEVTFASRKCEFDTTVHLILWFLGIPKNNIVTANNHME